jgi:hypothetical protein
MASSLGGLVVTLGLDAAEFFTGLTKSEQQAKKFAAQLDKQIASAAKFAAANFVILEGAILGAALAINHLVDQAASFKDIEEKTGASAETLAQFSVAAKVAGTTVDDVAAAMNKLAKNLTGVDDDSKAAGAALSALGIPIAEFKTLDPAAQMEAVAKALGGFEDGAQKSAVAMALFGKAGANLLPFFKELEQSGKGNVILTQAQIEKADEFADAQKRVSAQINLYAQALAVEALPAITGFITAGKETINQILGIDKATSDLVKNAAIRSWAEDAARSIAFVVDAVDGLIRAFQGVGLTAGAGMAQVAAAAKFQFGEVYRIGKEWQADMSALLERPLFSSKLNTAFTNQREVEALRRQDDRGFKPPGKKLDFEGAQKKDKGGVDKATQEAKRLLDVELKAQDRAIRMEEQLQKERVHFLQASYEDDLINYRDYFAEKQRLLDESQAKILAAQQAQIDAAQTFANRPGLKTDEKAAADEKVLALIDKRNEAIRAGEVAAFDAQRALNKEALAYTDILDETKAKVLELAGDLEGAAAIRFDKQNRSTSAIFRREGNTEGQAQLDSLKKQELANVALGKASREYGLIQAKLGNEQARIDLAVRSGASTTIDAINKRSEVTQKFVTQLSAKADEAAAAIARMVPGPEQDAAIAGLERMRLEIETLAQSAYELEDSFRKTFEDTFANALTDVVTGTKSVKEAFKDMEKQIIASISRIASQNIAESIFGQAGPASGASGFLASLFGGASRGGGSGSGGIGSLISSLFGGGETFQFGRAIGGPVSAGQSYLVGERGPELFQPRAAGNIVPNHELEARRARRSGDVNISISVPGNVSRSTADQIALKSGAAVQRAINRNG